MKAGCVVLFGLLVSSAASAENEECWQEGYKQGWCDAKGINNCLPPLPPLPPLAPLGRNDCSSRFADGYRQGLAHGH